MDTYSGSEGTNVSVCVEIAMGTLQRMITLTVAASDSSQATGQFPTPWHPVSTLPKNSDTGGDYTGLPADITFVSGNTTGDQICVAVAITADGALEDDLEDLVLVLTSAAERVEISPNMTTLSITDVDSEWGVSPHDTALRCVWLYSCECVLEGVSCNNCARVHVNYYGEC